MRNNKFNNNYRSAIRNLSIITIISITVGIVIFFIIVLWAFPLFSFKVSDPANWNLLEGFTSVISLSLLAGGLVFAVSEYINAENAKLAEKIAEERENAKISYEIYNAIYVKLTDPGQEAARRWILSNISIKEDEEDLAKWYEKTHAVITSGAVSSITGLPEGQHAIKQTLNCIDYIGFIASHYWDVDDDSMNWISAPIAKVWRRIGPYVKHVRRLRNTTDYYLFAERVGIDCVEWRKNKGLPDEEIAANTP
jgi:flagellar basal body-associated protein FliL